MSIVMQNEINMGITVYYETVKRTFNCNKYVIKLIYEDICK